MGYETFIILLFGSLGSAEMLNLSARQRISQSVECHPLCTWAYLQMGQLKSQRKQCHLNPQGQD